MFESVKRICQKCGTEFNEFKSVNSESVMQTCIDCTPQKLNFIPVETEHFKNYHRNGGNVSKARIRMVKSRRMHPEGNGEVILTKNGKITDKLSKNY